MFGFGVMRLFQDAMSSAVGTEGVLVLLLVMAKQNAEEDGAMIAAGDDAIAARAKVQQQRYFSTRGTLPLVRLLLTRCFFVNYCKPLFSFV